MGPWSSRYQMVNELERINSSRDKGNASLFVIYTEDLHFADASGTSMVWINNHSSLIGNYDGVYLSKVNFN